MRPNIGDLSPIKTKDGNKLEQQKGKPFKTFNEQIKFEQIIKKKDELNPKLKELVDFAKLEAKKQQ